MASAVLENETMRWVGPLIAKLPLVVVPLAAAWIALWMGRLQSAWSLLAKSYPFSIPFKGRLWRFRRVEVGSRSSSLRRVRWPADVGVCRLGLFLQPLPLGWRPFQAVFVPWNEIAKAEANSVLWSYLELHLRALPDVRVRLSKRTAVLVAAEAADAWPDGQLLLKQQ